MTYLIDRVLGGSHSSMLETYFAYTLALSMPIFKKKIFAEISGKKFQTFHCSKVTTMKSLELLPRNLHEYFFLKIGILSAKVNTKNVPNIDVCNFNPAPRVTSTCPAQKSVYQARHGCNLLIGCVKFCSRFYMNISTYVCPALCYKKRYR